MMKKRTFSLLPLYLVCLMAAGCASGDTGQLHGISPASQAITDSIQLSEPTSGTENNSSHYEAIEVDVDLSALSSIMVYAEVYNIMIDPESYVGKTIRGSGAYNSFYFEEIDRYFHYFVISDATGCCPQGLDFVWSGEHIYPDDYPVPGENIEVVGVFEKGEVEGQTYYYLAADDIVALK